MWLPETAVDLPTLQADGRGRHPAHDPGPWQVRSDHPDTRRPYRVDLRDGHHLVVALYDGAAVGIGLVRSVGDGRRGPIRPGTARAPVPGRSAAGRRAAAGRDRDRRRAVRPSPAVPRACSCAGSSSRNPDGSAQGFDVSSLADALREPAGRPFRPSGSRSERHGAAITASCAGAATARAPRTRRGRRRCVRPWTGWPRASTPARSGSPRSLPGTPGSMGGARRLRRRRRRRGDAGRVRRAMARDGADGAAQ